MIHCNRKKASMWAEHGVIGELRQQCTCVEVHLQISFEQHYIALDLNTIKCLQKKRDKSKQKMHNIFIRFE